MSRRIRPSTLDFALMAELAVMGFCTPACQFGFPGRYLIVRVPAGELFNNAPIVLRRRIRPGQPVWESLFTKPSNFRISPTFVKALTDALRQAPPGLDPLLASGILEWTTDWLRRRTTARS